MMARKMKDSGIPWIGEIPEEWEIGRAKEMFHHEQRPVRDMDEVVTCFRDGKVTLRKNRRTEGFTEALQEFGYQGIRKNDLVIHQMDAFAGSIGVSDSDGKGSPVLICCTPNGDLNSWYYCRLLRVMANQGWIKALYKGIRERSTDFRYDTFSQQMLPIPPLSEQNKIASYLDEKCSEIDELIDVEQKMIDELQAYRKATITESVTKGLDKEVSVRSTSIEQLEEIPEHWKEARLLKIVYLRARLGWRGLKAEEYVDEGYPFLSAFNIINNKLDWSDTNYINKFRYDESPEIKLALGDVLLVKDGAGIGKCARVDDMPKGEATVNSSLGVITVSDRLNYKYLYFYFLSHLFQELTERLRNGMGVPHLTQESMKGLVIPLPPLEEQQAIADYLDTKCKEIDDLIAVKREKIETLKQYRQSLIFEAVTGKIQLN